MRREDEHHDEDQPALVVQDTPEEAAEVEHNTLAEVEHLPYTLHNPGDSTLPRGSTEASRHSVSAALDVHCSER